jgi:hypothetical protein
MATRKTKTPPPKGTTTELRTVRLELPRDEHKVFRKLAAEEETNMALLARRIILDYIARQQKKGASSK